MKQSLLALLFMVTTLPVLAHGISARETECYNRVKKEADFIVSRINIIHHEYEKKIKRTGLGQFRSGDYSTTNLLDNTIRQYHRKLVHRIRNIPIHYATRLRLVQHSRNAGCLAANLQHDSIGTIHEFELSWQKALRLARKNARYFKELNDMR